MTQLISIFIYDVGGEFSSKDVKSICECIGEVKKERISDIYTDYFIELGMTPVRALVEERDVEFAGLKAALKKYLKVLVFGVVLVEFQFDFRKPLNFQKLREAALDLGEGFVDRKMFAEILFALEPDFFGRILLRGVGGK